MLTKSAIASKLEVVVALFVLLDIVLLVFFLNKHFHKQPSTTTKPILQVGDEIIYQKDLDLEKEHYL